MKYLQAIDELTYEHEGVFGSYPNFFIMSNSFYRKFRNEFSSKIAFGGLSYNNLFNEAQIVIIDNNFQIDNCKEVGFNYLMPVVVEHYIGHNEENKPIYLPLDEGTKDLIYSEELLATGHHFIHWKGVKHIYGCFFHDNNLIKFTKVFTKNRFYEKITW